MKRILAVFVLCGLLLVPAQAEGLAVEARSCILMEKVTGQILYAENEHEQLEPASVTKIMTILLVMEAIDSGVLSYDDMVSGSAYACSMGGSQIWLKENEQMSVRDMLKAVCVASANDCSVALGEHLSGSCEAFVERMNARAQELGMNDTHFVNPTGLPAEGHVTSAHDIALMSRELILNHPDIREFTTIWMDTLRNGEFGLSNTNKLVHDYQGTTGLKTGSTDAAGYCLAATAERDGMELIAVVLKSDTSAQRFESAKVLLNHGFSTYTLVHAAPEQVLPAIPVTMGTAERVQTVLGADPELLLEKAQAADLTQELRLEKSLQAPVEAGQQVGQLLVTAGGEQVAAIPIVAGETVERLTYGQILMKFFKMSLLLEPFRP